MGAGSSNDCLCCVCSDTANKEPEIRSPAARHERQENEFDESPIDHKTPLVESTDSCGTSRTIPRKPHDVACTSDAQEKIDSRPTQTCCTSELHAGSDSVMLDTQVHSQSAPSSQVEEAPPALQADNLAGAGCTDSQNQLPPTACPKRSPTGSLGDMISAPFKRGDKKGDKKSLFKLKTSLSKSWGNNKGASITGASQAGPSATRTKCKPSNNTNKPGDYVWLQEVLWNVVKNEAHSLDVVDTATSQGFTPIFFVLGSCPNTFCGMQAVMYSVSREREQDLDFWWVKPQKLTAVELERNTLSRNAKGPHKNDPGRSKPFYKAFADLFVQGSAGPPGMCFGIEKVNGKPHQSTARAYLKNDSDDSKMYLHLVWQEDWTTNPFSSKKYIRGKIVYQKDLDVHEFFSRQYCIKNGAVSISDVEEPSFKTILPSDEIKDLWDDVT